MCFVYKSTLLSFLQHSVSGIAYFSNENYTLQIISIKTDLQLNHQNMSCICYSETDRCPLGHSSGIVVYWPQDPRDCPRAWNRHLKTGTDLRHCRLRETVVNQLTKQCDQVCMMQMYQKFGWVCCRCKRQTAKGTKLVCEPCSKPACSSCTVLKVDKKKVSVPGPLLHSRHPSVVRSEPVKPRQTTKAREPIIVRQPVASRKSVRIRVPSIDRQPMCTNESQEDLYSYN